VENSVNKLLRFARSPHGNVRVIRLTKKYSIQKFLFNYNNLNNALKVLPVKNPPTLQPFPGDPPACA
jgi:hypothetical protein